jgi:ParB family transcriptional regulator, chromosome partitioning protein
MTMTDNHVTHLTDQPTTTSTGELVRVAATDVVIEDNVRTIADLDPAFLASVKQHGVLLPTIGYRGADGQVVVRDGQLRVLAARETDHDVPVFVTARDVTDAQRLVEQVVTNDRRTALTDGDRLNAYRQMELAGLSVTAIVQQTGTKRQTVKDTLTVAKSTVATEAVTERQMTFDQALILAEFDGDDDAVRDLTACIEDGDDDELHYVAAELRRERERAAAAAVVLAELVAAGKRVAGDDEDYEHLRNLTDADDTITDYRDRIPLTADTHATCDGQAWIVQPWGEPAPLEVCTTPTTHRPVHLPYRAPEAAPTSEPTPEEAEAAAEARKAARRELVANNKAWDAATDVRRAWLTTFLQRKTMPKDAATFLAVALTRHASLRDAYGSVRTIDLLQIDDTTGYPWDTVSGWAVQHPTKGLHVAVAVMLTGFENALNRDWWRYPNADARGYFTQLQAWGYPLSSIERTAASIYQDPDAAGSDIEPSTPDMA